MEGFTAVFLQFSGEDINISLLKEQLGTCHQIQAFQGIFFEIYYACQDSLSGSNNIVWFHLWLRRIVLKREKVYNVLSRIEEYSVIVSSYEIFHL